MQQTAICPQFISQYCRYIVDRDGRTDTNAVFFVQKMKTKYRNNSNIMRMGHILMRNKFNLRREKPPL